MYTGKVAGDRVADRCWRGCRMSRERLIKLHRAGSMVASSHGRSCRRLSILYGLYRRVVPTFLLGQPSIERRLRSWDVATPASS